MEREGDSKLTAEMEKRQDRGGVAEKILAAAGRVIHLIHLPVSASSTVVPAATSTLTHKLSSSSMASHDVSYEMNRRELIVHR